MSRSGLSRRQRTTPHLFDRWPSIARLIRARKKLALFLDFDGTLVEIVPRPELVRLEAGTRRILERLANHPGVTVALISGRERAELRSYVGIREMEYLGLYGWEQNGNSRLPLPVRTSLRRARTELTAQLAEYSGVWIEPKRNSFSVHLLGVDEQIQRQARQKVKSTLQPLRGILRAITNLRDIEVAPASVEGKGAAVRKALSEPGMRGALPVYFGDDLSDESAFGAVRGGIPILVGQRRKTRARFYLHGPAEVAATLSRMEAILS